jgi:integrase/recombinase XerD
MGRTGKKDSVVLVGVFQVVRRGKTYTYYRKKGLPLVRLPDAPHDSAEFLRAYADAKARKPDTLRRGASKTVKAACEEALSSAEFKSFSAGYRDLIRRNMDAIALGWGDLDASGMKTRHIDDDIASAPVPFHRIKAWRFLARVAVARGLLAIDHAAAASLPRVEPSDGHPAWSQSDVATFRMVHPIGTVARGAMELLFWSACRIGDAVEIGPGNVAGGVMAYRQIKTKAMAYVPWTCDLPDYAIGMEADRAMMLEAIAPFSGEWFLSAQGRKRSHKALGTMMWQACRDAGLDRSAHGLRKARATALAEAGATIHQIASWTGHLTLKEVERYTREADRRRAVMGRTKAER